MESRLSKRNLVWGGLLLFFGMVSFVDTFIDTTSWFLVIILAVAGLGVFVVYLSDRDDSVLLISVCVLWIVAAMIALIEINFIKASFVPTFISIVSAIPFLIVYMRNRTYWWALILGYVLLSVGILFWLLNTAVFEPLFLPAFISILAASPFLFVYFNNRTYWWALILGYVLLSVGILFWLLNTAVFEPLFLPAFISILAASPFLFVYFNNRTYWWALILGYVLLSVGILFWLLNTAVFEPLFLPAFISILTAIPFLFVYFNNRTYWWALIPGVIFGLVGLVFLSGSPMIEYILPASLTIVGVWILYRQLRSA